MILKYHPVHQERMYLNMTAKNGSGNDNIIKCDGFAKKKRNIL